MFININVCDNVVTTSLIINHYEIVVVQRVFVEVVYQAMKQNCDQSYISVQANPSMIPQVARITQD